jgi:hypothetical protein
MGRNLRILREEDWFLGKDDHQNYSINYRYVICYALLSFLSKNDYGKGAGRRKLEKLQEKILAGDHFMERDFLEVFFLEGDGGLVVVDQSEGIFPLILYSNIRTDVDKRERVFAFEKSLEDVIKNYDAVFEYFEGETVDSWNENFQKGLHERAGFSYETVS